MVADGQAHVEEEGPHPQERVQEHQGEERGLDAAAERFTGWTATTTRRATAAARWISHAHIPSLVSRQPSAVVHSRLRTRGSMAGAGR